MTTPPSAKVTSISPFSTNAVKGSVIWTSSKHSTGGNAESTEEPGEASAADAVPVPVSAPNGVPGSAPLRDVDLDLFSSSRASRGFVMAASSGE